ncbi:cell wall metabolism sensor histidine kinase WalK [Streptomyces sp. Amel2xB2]|uniref:sensor histidine kinase n=1 Tax=Streptomyces sp. Amel2xB2 TaxID=1305829 RepID=UPI0021AC1F3E|nr:ATP-binding protein [Streptomyces sp. Amel2xB2]
MNVNAAVAAAAAIAGVLTGVIAMLSFRWSERDQARPTRSSLHTEAVLPPGVDTVLSVLRSSAVVLDEADEVVKASSAAYALGLVRGGRLAVQPMLKMARETRRDGEIRQVDLDLPRRGTGRGDALAVSARVAPLGSRLVMLLVEDMTEARRIEAVRRDFVANVSHELKTPVGALSLLSEAVLDAADDPEAVERFAGRMQYESTRLTSLVQELIDLSRVQNDDPMGDSERVGVDELMAEAIDRCRQSAGSKQITLAAGRTGTPAASTSTSTGTGTSAAPGTSTGTGVRGGDAGDGLFVWGNRSQLAAALGNLVENAVNYSPARTRVGIAGRRVPAPGGDLIEISVSDQGIGISERDKERVFERFYRVDPARSRATGGTGLGLAIVKHVAASHGGEVTVWSAEGQGSTFTLRLPEAGSAQSRSGSGSASRSDSGAGGADGPAGALEEPAEVHEPGGSEEFDEEYDAPEEAREARTAGESRRSGKSGDGPAAYRAGNAGPSAPKEPPRHLRTARPPLSAAAPPSPSPSPHSSSVRSAPRTSTSPFSPQRGLLRAPETAPEVLP